MENTKFSIRILRSLAEVEATQWDALDSSSSPFTCYSFLKILEDTGCVGGATGWHSEHLTLWKGDTLVAAAPAYRKDHSFGEYVFDWAWADAYRRAGFAYYPKLLVAVPFSPVTGKRLLAHPQHNQSQLKAALVSALEEHARGHGYSSIHLLFPTPHDCEALQARGWMERRGFQFHWLNDGYRSFEHYLGSLSSRKRKNILRERRQVNEAGIKLRIVGGEQMDATRWDDFYRLYRTTAELKGGTAYLNRSFFEQLSQRMPLNVVVIEARLGPRLVGCAYCVRDANTLYGRSWGSVEFHPGLHFEACYYTPLNYCIEQGLKRFDAGAQGGHKLARGFMPTPTHSYHWIAREEFRGALRRYLAEETRHVEDYMDELEAAGPYRKTDVTEPP